MALFWLSFVDTVVDGVDKNLGVAIVEAEDIIDAVSKAWQAGCNPGGQVASWEIPPEAPEYLHQLPHNRLLSRAEVDELMPESGKTKRLADLDAAI